MGTYSSKFNLIEIEKHKNLFKDLGATFSEPAPQYMLFQARFNYDNSALSANFYSSGKFVIQGNNCEKFCAEKFGTTAPKVDINAEFSYPHIGIDESGKGDFFGPLVISGVYLDADGAKKCTEFGVCDSKKLNDKTILSLVPKIKSVSKFDTVVIGNKKYNELYLKFKNLNKLLAWGHATVLENLLAKTTCKLAISDKFADESLILGTLKEKGKNIKLIQMTKAESDIAVAAASILARGEFVTRLSRLSSQYELELPKGASAKVISQGKTFISKFGQEELQNVAKLHFKTSGEILN